MVRYFTDGSLDLSFGTQSILTTEIARGDNQALGVVQDASGRLIVSGITHDLNQPYRFSLLRYLINGILDTTFGTSGIVIPNMDPFSGDSLATGIALQSDGKIVVSGTSYHDATGASVQVGIISRYNLNGCLDSSFAISGHQLVSAFSLAGKVMIDRKGRIVISGTLASGSGNYEPTLVRLLSKGSLDTTFGSQGVVRANIGTGMNLFTDILLQADDRILGVAFSSDGHAQLNGYYESGSQDNSFGGWIDPGMGGTHD